MRAHELAGTIAGVAIILALMFVFMTASIPHVQAAFCVNASWYGQESGNRTANGEKFDGRSLTAASRTLPFGTRLRVTYRGKSVVVRINDRGPFVKGRSLDLSRAAAKRIGLIAVGVACVGVERL